MKKKVSDAFILFKNGVTYHMLITFGNLILNILMLSIFLKAVQV